VRIHRLSVAGIGPYATRQELDFDDLTSSGLFLLTGPTGAGKTTVLDAVVFALYGTVPGARGADGKREKGARERIVSDLRDLDTTPEVELEFTAGGRRFLVRRSPDHDRPKARGTGTTVAKASAGLEERINGEWVPRSVDFREISIELEQVLGMSAAQFTQVVLLPQGEFAGFLRASVGDRRKVLERLFQVDQYESAEQWFKARADAAKETLASAQAGLERVVERLAGALGEDAGPDEVIRELAGPEEISAWVSSRRMDVDERVMERERVYAERFAESNAAVAAHDRAAAISEHTQALAERDEDLHVHATRLPKARAWVASREGDEVGADEARWEPAARAARALAHGLAARVADERRLPELLAGAARADDEAAAAETQAAEADVAVTTTVRGIEPLRAAAEAGARAEASAAGLRRERDELAARAEAAVLRDRLAREAEGLRGQLDAAAAEHRAAEAARDAHASEEELDRTGAELAAKRRELGQARVALEAEISQVIRDAERVAADRAAHDTLAARRTELETQTSEAREAHLTARAAYLSAREARLNAMAAELAADLEDGAPCPVCGSVDHPSPADGGGTHDLRAAETAAGQEAERRERTYAAAQQALDTCAGQLAALDADTLAERAATVAQRGQQRQAALTQLSGEESALARQVEASAAAVQARRAAVRRVAETQAGLADVEHRRTAVREALAGARAKAGDGAPPSEALGQVDARLASLGAEIAAAADARERIVALEHDVERQRHHGNELRATVAARRQAARSLRDEATRLEQDLATLRGSHESVETAARLATEYADVLDKAVELLANHRTAQNERNKAAASLAERVAADIVAPDEPADLAERVAQRAIRRRVAGEAATDAAGLLHHARVQQTAIEDAESALADAIRTLGPAAEAAERLIRLDLTVRGGGDNLRKISLATYVLAARLEEVAAAATTHLLRMSNNRYELLHHDDRFGSGQAGLGLRVRDGWTGEDRDTATLSGGEAFYASLSLALGLAEVVTNEAGGRPLETLLVDEGFGSLDPDTLEHVLDELDQLRAAGRAVGVVSHVAALAERIPAQLRVEPGRSGSTATVVTGAPV
jgi:exonuclease SbcC